MKNKILILALILAALLLFPYLGIGKSSSAKIPATLTPSSHIRPRITEVKPAEPETISEATAAEKSTEDSNLAEIEDLLKD